MEVDVKQRVCSCSGLTPIARVCGASVLALMCLGMGSAMSPHQNTRKDNSEEAEKLIQNATTGLDLKKGYSTLLRHATPDSLAKYKCHQNTGIALGAAWEGVNR